MKYPAIENKKKKKHTVRQQEGRDMTGMWNNPMLCITGIKTMERQTRLAIYVINCHVPVNVAKHFALE